MNTIYDDISICQECGWKTFSTAATCPVCGGAVEPVTAGSGNTLPYSRQSFALSTLFLVITLICVCLGAIAAAPGLGIPLTVLSVPALIRTWAASRFSGARASAASPIHVVESFFKSLNLMFLISVAGVIAFQIACWTSCLAASSAGSTAFLIGIICGSLVGIIAVGYLLFRTWPRKT